MCHSSNTLKKIQPLGSKPNSLCEPIQNEILKSTSFGQFILKYTTLKKNLHTCYFLIINLTKLPL